MDSRGLVWTRCGIGSTPQNHYLTTRCCKKEVISESESTFESTPIYNDFVRFEDSPRLGFYKINKEPTRGGGLKAITNIALGTRYPNGLHTKKSFLRIWHELFSHRCFCVQPYCVIARSRVLELRNCTQSCNLIAPTPHGKK